MSTPFVRDVHFDCIRHDEIPTLTKALYLKAAGVRYHYFADDFVEPLGVWMNTSIVRCPLPSDLCAATAVRAVKDTSAESLLAAAEWFYAFRPLGQAMQKDQAFCTLYEGLIDTAVLLSAQVDASLDARRWANRAIEAKTIWLSKINQPEKLERVREFHNDVRRFDKGFEDFVPSHGAHPVYEGGDLVSGSGWRDARAV